MSELILGEITVSKKRTHGWFNGVIVLYEEPADWFMKQFPTRQALEIYAMENHLVIKDEE